MGTGAWPEDYAEDALRAVVARYEAAKAAALRDRDASLRAFHAAGWRTTDLQRVTGYSRETIRLAMSTQARESVNALRREATARRRMVPWVVPKTLAELVGPTQGVVTLPREVLDMEELTFDLSRAASVSSMYELVLVSSRSIDHLRTWINGEVLLKRWAFLPLPWQLKELWERRFPELARRYREPE